MLAQQLVVCKCKKIMTYEELIGDHKLACLKKKLPCPLGCGHVITPALNQMIHYWQCPKAMQECSKCKQVYLLEDKLVHQGSCPEEIITCNQCSQKHKRKDVSKVCPEATISCSECQASMKRKDFKTHKESCQMLLQTCAKCQNNYLRKDELQHDCIKAQAVQLH